MATFLPAGNANPQIPEELLFWSNIDLHQQLVYSSNGTYQYPMNVSYHLKAALMGNTNFWIRGHGDPFLTNFDRLSHGIGQPINFDIEQNMSSSFVATYQNMGSASYGTVNSLAGNNAPYLPAGLQPPDFTTEDFHDDDCGCKEVSGSIRTDWLNGFKHAKHYSKTYPSNHNYDIFEFFRSSSRITSYGNRVLSHIKNNRYSSSLGSSGTASALYQYPYDEGKVLTNDYMVYINGTPTHVMKTGVKVTMSAYTTGHIYGPYNAGDIGWHWPHNNYQTTASQHFEFERNINTLENNAQYPNSIYSLEPSGAVLKHHPGGVTVGNSTFVSAWWKNWPTYLPAGRQVDNYFYEASTQLETLFQTVGGNNIAFYISMSSASGVANGVQTHAGLYTHSSGDIVYGMDVGSTMDLNRKQLFKDLWYIDDWESFGSIVKRNVSGNYVGGEFFLPMYFSTASTVTTKVNGDWMPEGTRSKAESLALALNFYGQFWGTMDHSRANQAVAAQHWDPTPHMSGSGGTNYYGYHGLLGKAAYMRAPYSWSVGANDVLIYTSSFCSGSRIHNQQNTVLAWYEGPRPGDGQPPVDNTHPQGTQYPDEFAGYDYSPVHYYPYSHSTQPLKGMFRTGSIVIPGARGYTTFSADFDNPDGTTTSYLINSGFSQSVNGFYVNNPRAIRFSWDLWKQIADTGVTASYLFQSTHDMKSQVHSELWAFPRQGGEIEYAIAKPAWARNQDPNSPNFGAFYTSSSDNGRPLHDESMFVEMNHFTTGSSRHTTGPEHIGLRWEINMPKHTRRTPKPFSVTIFGNQTYSISEWGAYTGPSYYKYNGTFNAGKFPFGGPPSFPGVAWYFTKTDPDTNTIDTNGDGVNDAVIGNPSSLFVYLVGSAATASFISSDPFGTYTGNNTVPYSLGYFPSIKRILPVEKGDPLNPGFFDSQMLQKYQLLDSTAEQNIYRFMYTSSVVRARQLASGESCYQTQTHNNSMFGGHNRQNLINGGTPMGANLLDFGITHDFNDDNSVEGHFWGNFGTGRSGGGGVEVVLQHYGRWVTFADNQQYYSKRPTCTCNEIFAWRALKTVRNDEVFDLEFTDGYKFSDLGGLNLYIYNPLFPSEGTPIHPLIPDSADWPKDLRAVSVHELYHFTGSAPVLGHLGYVSASVSTYTNNNSIGFIKCADIIPGTTKTSGYVRLKSIKRRVVSPSHAPDHLAEYGPNQANAQFLLQNGLCGEQEGQFTPFAYQVRTDYPKNYWGPNHSGSVLTDGMLMLENGLYVGFIGLNCWTFDQYKLESRSPQGRASAVMGHYTGSGGAYKNEQGFTSFSNRPQ